MRFKQFTQAYFLITNNPSYMYSFLKRVKAITLNLTLIGIVFASNLQLKVPTPAETISPEK